MKTADLDYHLPRELIATRAAEPRDSARLFVARRSTGEVEHRHVHDLLKVDGGPQAGDLMVFNETRVLPAYFQATRVGTGGRVSALYLDETTIDCTRHWRVMVESRGKLQPGEVVQIDDRASLRLVERIDAGEWLAVLESSEDTITTLQRVGSPPLPPYIRKQRKQHGESEINNADAERYNTVYARVAGSVAAPTAGLHFTPALLETLQSNGVKIAKVTLHVGMGTFAPVRSERLEDHDIHSERIVIPADTLQALTDTRRNGGRILPVGTTTVRALESLPADFDPTTDHEADTNLFITPGHDGETAWPYRFTDGLMTNFHLPQSTLLAMVAALPDVGLSRLKGWYAQAIEQGYRFYSYGDAMLII